MNHVMSTELKTTTEQSETVDLRTGEILPAPPDVTAVAEQLVAAARGQGIELTGPNGLLTGLTRQVLQSALEAELTVNRPDFRSYREPCPTGAGLADSWSA